MPMNEALDAVDLYKKDYGLSGTLEALQDMKANYELLSRRERAAYNVAMAGFRELFAPVTA